MVFPLFRTWLKPLIGSSARTTDKLRTPDGFRSIGGGGGPGGSESRSNRRRGPHTNSSKGVNPLTNVSFTESEERIVNEIKLQSMRSGAGTATVTAASGAVSTTAQDGQKETKGIVVTTDFDISEDRSSHHNELNATRIHEPW
jgi:hypothetical protein